MGIITLHFRLPYIVEILIERTKAGGGENSGRPSECLGGEGGERMAWTGGVAICMDRSGQIF